MEQLIFIGIIVFFSMLEAAARKRREANSDELPLPPGEPREVRLPPLPEAKVPTYDADPTFDDAVEAGSQGRGATSEGLIPADVWEEIQAMARGGPPAPRQSRTPAPAPTRSRPAPARTERARPVPMSTEARKTRAPSVPEVDVVAPTKEHAVHLAHAAYGRPVQERLTALDLPGDRRRGLSADGTAVRNVLRKGGAGLRQAVLLQEILGPPVSLKDDPSAG